MTRDEWDSAFAELLNELKQEELSEYINASVIAGRCSIILLAQEALEEGMTLEEFLEGMQEVIVNEYNSGVVDGDTFRTFESIAEDDVNGEEI
jgi:hypothetical protein